MLKIRECSDLHLGRDWDRDGVNQFDQILPALTTDSETVLVIAGDLGSHHCYSRSINFLQIALSRFRHVIFVLGNHDYYGGYLQTVEAELATAAHTAGLDVTRLTIAGQGVQDVSIDGVRFLCTTLWSNLTPNATRDRTIRQSLNDYVYIRNSRTYSTISTSDTHAAHEASVSELCAALQAGPRDRTVVVSHHLPTWAAVAPKYMLSERDRHITAAFASNLDQLITDFGPTMWFFGHTHDAWVGRIHNTQLVCNPLGYVSENNLRAGRFSLDHVWEI